MTYVPKLSSSFKTTDLVEVKVIFVVVKQLKQMQRKPRKQFPRTGGGRS